MINLDSLTDSENKGFNVKNVGEHVTYSKVGPNVTTVSVGKNIKTNNLPTQVRTTIGKDVNMFQIY